MRTREAPFCGSRQRTTSGKPQLIRDAETDGLDGRRTEAGGVNYTVVSVSSVKFVSVRVPNGFAPELAHPTRQSTAPGRVRLRFSASPTECPLH
jgi:hypothetical protein